MEKILKFLRKLTPRELMSVEDALSALKQNQISGYNIKKLTGFSDIYRLRVQDIRIIFRKEGDVLEILDIGRRSEKTYKKF